MSDVHRITLSIGEYLDRTFRLVEVACVDCGGEVLLHPPEDDVSVPWWCEVCTDGDRPVPAPRVLRLVTENPTEEPA